MISRSCLFVLLFAACGGTPLDPETAKKAVSDAYEAQNKPGRTGVELLGKNVWLEAPMFDPSCLISKELAFPDDPSKRTTSSGVGRISPTYTMQRFLTASTEKGFCLYLGEDPSMEIKEASWGGDRYRVWVHFGMKNPSPWFACLDKEVTDRLIEVTVDEAGQTHLSSEPNLGEGACPHPMPTGEERASHPRPKAAPPKKPSSADVVSLVKAYDQALWDGDFVKAKQLTSCVNLFEEQKWGSCSVAEFLAIGPVPRGEVRIQDGTPWHEYAFKSLDDPGKIQADKSDPTIFHVVSVDPRTRRDRGFAIQWADGSWKMLGIVGQKAEGITSARVLNDLQRKERREIFDTRLQGEMIDWKGEPLDPELRAAMDE